MKMTDEEYFMELYGAYDGKEYLCDIENVVKIYIRFCEFLETMDYDQKRYFISKLDRSNDSVRYSTFPYTNEEYEEFKEADTRFVDFLREYLDENPDLEIYREEIISMRYDPNMYYKGLLIFKNTNNMSYLK
jgi:hypothetical protein